MNEEDIIQKQESPKIGLTATLLWSLIIIFVTGFVASNAMRIYKQITYGASYVEEFGEEFIDLAYNGTTVSVGIIVSSFAGCGILYLVLKNRKNLNIKDYLGLKSFDLKTLMNWLFVFIAFFILYSVMNIVLHKTGLPEKHVFFDQTGDSEFVPLLYSSTEHVWVLLLGIAVVTPLFEEILIRGFVISGLVSSGIGPAGAVLISSVLFTVLHFQYGSFSSIAFIFIFGLILGTARIKTGSVLLPALLHSVNNAWAVVVTMISAV